MFYCVEGVTLTRDSNHDVRHIGEFESLEAAIVVAKQTIDEYLNRELEPGISAASLLARYKHLGETPYIFRYANDQTINVPEFNHDRYATVRCKALCNGQKNDDWRNREWIAAA